MVNVIILAKAIAKKLVRVDVNQAVVEVPVAPILPHPTIILNNHFQVALIVQEDAKTVVLLVVGQLVMINVRIVAKRLVKGHALAIVKAAV